MILFIIFIYLYQSNKHKNYDKLIKYINCVSKTMYINYGLWDYNNTLEDANINLCTFIFNKAKLSKNHSILDIGCGYGQQDFLLH